MQKRIVEVNLGNFGSTGGIMKNIARTAEARGDKVIQIYPDSPSCKINDGEIGRAHV